MSTFFPVKKKKYNSSFPGAKILEMTDASDNLHHRFNGIGILMLKLTVIINSSLIGQRVFTQSCINYTDPSKRQKKN